MQTVNVDKICKARVNSTNFAFIVIGQGRLGGGREGWKSKKVLFSKVVFWKLLHHSYVQSSFSIITKYIKDSILKDTLRLFTDMDQHTYFFR